MTSQQGSTLSNQNKKKSASSIVKPYAEEKKMTDTPTMPVILEKIVKAALKVLGRKKSPRVDGIPTELLQARG